MSDIPTYEHIIISNDNEFDQARQITNDVNHFVATGRNVTIKIHPTVVVNGVLIYSAEIMAVRRTLPGNIITISA